MNAGAWTHYSWAIRDALDLTGIPTVEVRISDTSKREKWHGRSVFEGLDLIVGPGIPARARTAMRRPWS